MLLVSRLGAKGPMSVSRLTEGSSITRQAVTKHLRVLEGVGLAHAERSGRETLWALDARPLVKARQQLDVISQQWDQAIDRLRAFVEEAP